MTHRPGGSTLTRPVPHERPHRNETGEQCTPATLPTTGYARFSSGVTAHTFLVRQAVAGLTEDEFWRLAPTVAAFCDHEGFPAHAATIEVRRP